ncbi:cysteine-rich receptor-like protein kinase, partial [Tanacetum coccineum]
MVLDLIIKKNWVNRLIVHECPLFFGIQESKLNYVDQSVVRSLWPRTYVSYASRDFLAVSGGIITMWDSRFFAMEHEFANMNFLGMVGSWTGVVSKVGLLNVYAPMIEKRFKESLVRCQDERVGSVFDANDANSFNDFLSRAGLFDFPLGGRKFTRFDKYGEKASKLDRFLASQKFFNCWNDASVSVLCRSFSDHYPIILKEDIKNDFWSCIKYFEATGKIANGCNPSFVVLVPKNIDPLGFLDYRPISLIGCVYKVISKILANRLAKVIASVIGPNQSVFIEGRQILDGCLIANEIIRIASIEKLKLLLFKVDFDSVNWNFLLDTMRQMGFGSKWRNWITSCLSSASISILVNGSPTKEFKLEKGLRQGDPLSPFLFLIVAEALQVSILEACNKGFYKGLYLVDNNTNISLLQ